MLQMQIQALCDCDTKFIMNRVLVQLSASQRSHEGDLISALGLECMSSM